MNFPQHTKPNYLLLGFGSISRVILVVPNIREILTSEIKRGYLRNLQTDEAELREETKKKQEEMITNRKRQRTGNDGEIKEHFQDGCNLCVPYFTYYFPVA